MADPQEPKDGDRLFHYHLIKELGAGGMGTVFKAHDETLDRYTAIKILSPRLADQEEFVARFLAEARAVARLNHPNIIQIFHVGQQNKTCFFAMEFVEGQTLQTLMQKREKLAEREAVDPIRQAALGLQHAAQYGVIHRDIKPSNLMLTREGVIKITDFGLAKQLDPVTSQNLHLTATGVIIGTPHYMSPEQVNGGKADHRSDIYSLGATLYHLLAGRPPFVGESGVKIMVQHLEIPAPPIENFNPSISPPLRAILRKTLAKNPIERYQNYDELIHDLDLILQSPAKKRENTWMGMAVAVLAIFVILLTVLLWLAWRPPAISRLPPESLPVASSATPGPKPAVPEPAPPLQSEKLTDKMTPVFLPLDLSTAFNADIITTEAHVASDVFEPQWRHGLATTSWIRLKGSDSPGIPEDGRIAIPQGNPKEFFQLKMPPEKNVILLTDREGRQPNPVAFELPEHQIRPYSRLAILHGACWGDGVIKVTLHYANDNTEKTLRLQALDWNARTRSESPVANESVAITAGATRVDAFSHEAELFAQLFDLDSKRALKSLTFSVESTSQPRGLGANTGKFTTGIFAVSAFPKP